MLVVFDLDGTLFQAKHVVLLAVRRLLGELGIAETAEDQMLRNAGHGPEAMLRDILGEDAVTDATLARYDALLHGAIIERGELFPGVPEMLRRLAEDGHELVVCSNSPADYVGLVLERTGVARWIAMHCSATPSSPKSDLIRGMIERTKRCCWQRFTEERGLSAAGGSALQRREIPAVVVGDTHGDVEAAHRNGIPAIAVTYGYGNTHLLAAADYTVHSAAEIAMTIHRLACSNG